MFKFLKSTVKSAGKGVYKDPEFQKIVEKYPRFFRFLKKRLTPDEKFGLMLTLGVLIALIFIILFFSISRDLWQQDSLVQADLRIINLVQVFRSTTFNNAMLFITYLGKGQIVFLGVTIAGIILVMLKYWRRLTSLIVSVAASEVFVWILKNLFERPRPPLVNALLPESGYSFPSGHAFVAVSFYGFMSYLFYRESKSNIIKIISIALGLLIILAIGFSRIYLGVHWPSDVLASFVSSAAWLTVIITILEIRRRFNPKEKRVPYYKKSKLVILSAALITIWIMLIIFYFNENPLKPQVRIPEKQIMISTEDIPDNLFSVFPRTSETISGEEMEPISLIIIGNEQEIKTVFEQAGWFPTDPVNAKSIWKVVIDTIFNNPYPNAPGIPSFWNARPNDFAYGKPTGANLVSERQHIHFWKTQFIFENQAPIWFCNAHFDGKISFSTLFLPVHSIDPAIDKEREKIKDDIAKTGYMKSLKEFLIVEPTLSSNQGGDQFFTDGKAYIIYLKR